MVFSLKILLFITFFKANLQESIATGFETNILKGFEDPIDHHPIARGDKNKIFDLKESVGKIRITSSVDPIEFLHAWMKSEEKEVEGFLDSIRQRDNLIMLRGKILEKQKAKARELDKVANGSITLKTLFSMKGKAIEMDTMEKQIANVRYKLGVSLVYLDFSSIKKWSY